jgi:O-antigen/teichoic acid export membrane protein
VTWNLAGLAFTSAAGVILNVLIAVFYDAAVLGVFSQVFALYVFFSQFSVLGIHFSVMQGAARHAGDVRKVRSVLIGALVPTIVLSAAFTSALVAARGYVGQILSSPGVAAGIAWAGPGLFLFGINKILQSATNGLGWMGWFAALQTLRSAVMLAAFGFVWLARMPGESISVVFTVSEACFFVVAAVLLAQGGYIWGPVEDLAHWMKWHLWFGLRSFPIGALTALNTRLDVLMLGYFTNDAMVGIYSLPAMLAMGIYQILIVLRNNYNPRLLQKYHAGMIDSLEADIRRGKRRTYLLMAMAGALIVALYPVGVWAVGGKKVLMDGWPVTAILIAGLVAGAGYVPFNHLLMLAGRPAVQAGTVLVAVAVNFLGNLVLIPCWAACGAAVATGIAILCHTALLIYLTKRLIRVRI